MAEPWRSTPSSRARDAKVRVARLAERQWGVVTGAQLDGAGLGSTAVSRWVRDARLHRLYPGVYAVGHRHLSVQGRLAAALLYAGRGAALSHRSAAWWWGLLGPEPPHIHVSIAGRRRPQPGLRPYSRRRVERAWHGRLPVTTVARTLLDVAADVPFDQLRRALAGAEYRRLVELDEVAAVLGRGQPGSAALRAALERHRPELARTLSVLEERFLELCEEHGIPVPEVNVEVAGLMVDAFWREQRVVVELDGHAAHGTPAAAERDRRRELTLRAAGCRVLRYTWRQVTREPVLVATDVLATLR